MGARQFIQGQIWRQWGSPSSEQTTAHSPCMLYMFVKSHTHFFECVYVHRMHGLSDTAKEVCGKFSGCTELGEVLIRPQLCQICPNQTRRPEKTQAAHRGLPNQGNRERKREGRRRFHRYSSDLVSDRGQRHGFQRIKKAVTISGKLMRFWFVEWWAGLLFPMSYWFGRSIY